MRAFPHLARGLVVALVLAAVSCGLKAPTPPEQEQERDTSSVAPSSRPPAAPGASPTATPSPTDASPSPSPSPTPDASGCGEPLPPPISQIAVKIHLKGDDAWTLDSTPQVVDRAYCAAIGFTDGRSFCPVRPEGNPERPACELYAVGRAQDTNRPGPTWRFKDRFCTGKASGCMNHPENQYLLKVYVSGTFEACARNGVCGEVAVDR